MSTTITACTFVRITHDGKHAEFPIDDGDSYIEIFKIAHSKPDRSAPSPMDVVDEPPGRRARLWAAAMRLRDCERALGLRP
jgi:hypothetical protein